MAARGQGAFTAASCPCCRVEGDGHTVESSCAASLRVAALSRAATDTYVSPNGLR